MELLKKLCFASGVSGFEAEIKEIIAAEIKDYAELKTDAKGNLIAVVKGEKRDKTVCFFAPLDENGFLVNGHTENGEISVTSVGKTEPDSLMGKKLYKSGKTGVINQLPVHLSSKDDKKRLLKEEEITVDFGFESKEEAKSKLCEGEALTFAPVFFEEGGKIFAKALERRAGVFALIELIKSKPKFDTFFVFTVCERVGFLGSRAAAFNLKPDVAIYADYLNIEEQGAKTQSGAALVCFNESSFSSAALFKEAKDILNGEKIPFQLALQKAEANGTGEIAASGAGCKVLTVSLPVKNANTPLAVADKEDISSLIKVLEALNERI